MSACLIKWCDNQVVGDCERSGHYGDAKTFEPIAPDYCRDRSAEDVSLRLGTSLRLRPGQVMAQVGLYLYGHDLDVCAYLLPEEARELAGLLDAAASLATGGAS